MNYNISVLINSVILLVVLVYLIVKHKRSIIGILSILLITTKLIGTLYRSFALIRLKNGMDALDLKEYLNNIGKVTEIINGIVFVLLLIISVVFLARILFKSLSKR